ncbi:unnamed protein product, partial [Prorocentrum cordatum]
VSRAPGGAGHLLLRHLRVPLHLRGVRGAAERAAPGPRGDAHQPRPRGAARPRRLADRPGWGAAGRLRHGGPDPRAQDVERAAARGRASVRAAFARVRAQLQDREAELMESLDVYESDSLARLDHGGAEHAGRLSELRRLQDSLRDHCHGEANAVEALNTYAAAKAAIVALREAFSHEDFSGAPAAPDEFVGLASGARAELDSHAEGLASLEEAVAGLCQRGVEFPQPSPRTAGFMTSSGSALGGPEPLAPGRHAPQDKWDPGLDAGRGSSARAVSPLGAPPAPWQRR